MQIAFRTAMTTATINNNNNDDDDDDNYNTRHMAAGCPAAVVNHVGVAKRSKS